MAVQLNCAIEVSASMGWTCFHNNMANYPQATEMEEPRKNATNTALRVTHRQSTSTAGVVKTDEHYAGKARS